MIVSLIWLIGIMEYWNNGMME